MGSMSVETSDFVICCETAERRAEPEETLGFFICCESTTNETEPEDTPCFNIFCESAWRGSEPKDTSGSDTGSMSVEISGVFTS